MTSQARQLSGAPSPLDLDRFAAAPLQRAPFDHLILPDFLRPDAQPALAEAFPAIKKGGSFPAASLKCSNAFQALLDELQGPNVTAAFSEKFGIDLSDHPTMVTLRGMSRAKDGQIHRDSESKLLTALIYMNPGWQAPGGRLRILDNPDNLEPYCAEVVPELGTLIAFRCSPNAYHGHTAFVGPRRSIQLNWVRDESVVRRELSRHGLSAMVKKLNPFGGK